MLFFFIEEKIIRKSEGVNSLHLHVKKILKERERKSLTANSDLYKYVTRGHEHVVERLHFFVSKNTVTLRFVFVAYFF